CAERTAGEAGDVATGQHGGRHVRVHRVDFQAAAIQKNPAGEQVRSAETQRTVAVLGERIGRRAGDGRGGGADDGEDTQRRLEGANGHSAYLDRSDVDDRIRGEIDI